MLRGELPTSGLCDRTRFGGSCLVRNDHGSRLGARVGFRGDPLPSVLLSGALCGKLKTNALVGTILGARLRGMLSVIECIVHL